MSIYRSDMIRDANGGGYYVEIQEIETAELIFTGRRCKTRKGAHKAAMDALGVMFNVARTMNLVAS